MKKNLKYLILPCIQALEAVLLFFHEINLPSEISIYAAVIFLVCLSLGILLLRLAVILILSYIINVTKFIIYKIRKEDVISFCFYPLLVYKGKKWQKFWQMICLIEMEGIFSIIFA